MPILQQMVATVNKKTYFSRPDEVLDALDQAGFRVYSAVLKEFSGFFLKFDTTTVVLAPGTQTYNLPPDLSQLVNIAERQTALEDWHPMLPESLSDQMADLQSLVGWNNWGYDTTSPFQFYGPYLTASAVQGQQVQAINVSPLIDAPRMVELAYTAKWLPILNAQSTVMLPVEGTYAMQSYAVAELLRSNDDSLSREYEMKGDRDLSAFLSWVRNRQLVKARGIAPYLG